MEVSVIQYAYIIFWTLSSSPSSPLFYLQRFIYDKDMGSSVIASSLSIETYGIRTRFTQGIAATGAQA